MLELFVTGPLQTPLMKIICFLEVFIHSRIVRNQVANIVLICSLQTLLCLHYLYIVFKTYALGDYTKISESDK